MAAAWRGTAVLAFLTATCASAFVQPACPGALLGREWTKDGPKGCARPVCSNALRMSEHTEDRPRTRTFESSGGEGGDEGASAQKPADAPFVLTKPMDLVRVRGFGSSSSAGAFGGRGGGGRGAYSNDGFGGGGGGRGGYGQQDGFQGR
ncbi:unnamed protein product, partial [Scytosiphon promiscuus]